MATVPRIPDQERNQTMHRLRIVPLAALILSLSACKFSSTATRWNGLYGPDGQPVFVKTNTNVGMNFLIVIRFLGSTTLPHQIDKLTSEIADEEGTSVRMIESSSENYWYGFAPITWIFTPVITTVSADYHPSAEELAKAQAEEEEEKAEK